MPEELKGWCRICGEPARGKGGTMCFLHQKRAQRGIPLDFEQRTPAERLFDAAIALADADSEDDAAFEAAKQEHEAAWQAKAVWLGWKRPGEKLARYARRSVRSVKARANGTRSLEMVTLFDWAQNSRRETR